MNSPTHCLETWGDLACFSRPEMKVERYSYPIITPSAARGIFDAIYFKKEYNFYWQIERIELLQPPKYIALRRNEVKDKISVSEIQKWMNGTKDIAPLWADGTQAELGTDQKGRTQRQTMALKNVRYRIYAHIVCRDQKVDLKALNAQFERRATIGKCFYQPFFGCREFPAYFELLQTTPETRPVDIDLDLGWMLYDVFDLRQANHNQAKPSISVFRAQLKAGVLHIPAYPSPDVHKLAGDDHAE
ncbi:MAG: type I-C CRISPR-associated protein Cas5c [Methylovulum sp.]|nr:type I-C CRISPR-associated protein Cas5c [Methylovulum sp.]